MARLIGQVLTNRQIVNRLHLSERTVENHIQKVLNKLGLTNRTQVAVWLSEQQV